MENYIKMELKDAWREDVHWIHLAHGWVRRRVLVHTIMNLKFPRKAQNFLTSLLALISSSMTLLHTANTFRIIFV